MSVVLPEILYRTKRGLCPNCGAPLDIDPDAPTTRCGFCGGQAVLERRLRRVEPEVAGAPLRLYFDVEAAAAGLAPDDAPWVRSKQFRQADVERAACPGCGDAIAYADDLAVVTCRSCGTESRLERRLRAPAPDASREVPRPRHPSEQHRRDRDDAPDANPATEHLIWRVIHEPDLPTRIALAWRLGEEWKFVNPTAARFLPALLRSLKGADPRVQHAASELVTKLLCEGDPALRNATIQACERVLFDLDCPRPILFHVGMGDGTCVKLLLDAAEFGVRRGDLSYASAALLGVNYIFQRNFPQHAVMGDIILYRMLYLTGPTLAFAFLLAQRQVTGTGFHYPPETLLRFIDEAAAERPTLVPELFKSFYCGAPADEAAYRARLAFYATLRTYEARAAALRHWLSLPEGAPDALFADFIAFLEPLLDDPRLGDAAAVPLKDAVNQGWRRMPEPVHDLVRRRGDALPAEVRRAYLQHVKESPHLDSAKLPYWQPDEKPAIAPDMRAALAQWKAGLSAAVRAEEAVRQAFREYWATVEDKFPPIWDGKSDGPAPAEADATAGQETVVRDDRPRPGDETAPPEAEGAEDADGGAAAEGADPAAADDGDNDGIDPELLRLAYGPPPLPPTIPFPLTPEQQAIVHQSLESMRRAWAENQANCRRAIAEIKARRARERAEAKRSS